MTGATTVVPSAWVPAIDGAGLTHPGLVRERNEDAILTDPSGTLWAVADGMGGHGHGDVASDIVIDVLATIEDGSDAAASLRASLSAANAEICRRALQVGTMGATVAALMIQNAVGHVAWAGDSRVYLLRNGRLRLLTSDHSLVQDLVDRGELAPEDVEDHPDAHIVTRAVGGGPELELEVEAVPLIPGDRLMLCTDGLSRCLHDGAIAERLREATSAETACRALLSDSLAAGARDNVSVIAVFVGER